MVASSVVALSVGIAEVTPVDGTRGGRWQRGAAIERRTDKAFAGGNASSRPVKLPRGPYRCPRGMEPWRGATLQGGRGVTGKWRPWGQRRHPRYTLRKVRWSRGDRAGGSGREGLERARGRVKGRVAAGPEHGRRGTRLLRYRGSRGGAGHVRRYRRVRGAGVVELCGVTVVPLVVAQVEDVANCPCQGAHQR